MSDEFAIMVVDDSPTMRKIMKHHLTQLGYITVVEASNGQEGIRKIEQNRIDLIFCDWNMPEMNGLQFLHELRKKNIDIPVIMVTTVNTKEEVMAALEAGAAGYIVKPFSREDLKEKVEQIKNK